MDRVTEGVTILIVGDKSDYDSYKKLHKEKRFILRSGFDYRSVSYKRFLTKGPPPIKTKKVIVFLSFPFAYWNRYIEHKHYKGIYGNRTFFRKFLRFWEMVDKVIKNALRGKEIVFINTPSSCGLYRDKLLVLEKCSRSDIPCPKRHTMQNPESVRKLLEEGRSLFFKPRYGSMGKGFTFLSRSRWQTNFTFRKNKIISKKSDRGWKFRNIMGNNRFLRQLLKGDILVEDGVDSLILKNMKFDTRVYTFFNKVIYVYPRKNRADRITTNISQGAKGDPKLLRRLPKGLLDKTKKLAEKVSTALGVNMAGIDIIIDRNLKSLYVLDVNIFPGFPKRKTYNLSRRMVRELARLKNGKKLNFCKI